MLLPLINFKGRAVLAIISLLVVLALITLFLYKFSRNDNNSDSVPSVEKGMDYSETIPVNPSINPFAERAPSKAVQVSTDTADLKADIEIRSEGVNKLYTDNKHGFSFKFANSLTLNGSVSDNKFAQFLEYQNGSGNVARMVLQVFDNPENSTLEDVIKREKYLTADQLGPKYENFKINGRDALKLTKTMTQTEICNDGDGSTKNRIFAFLVKGDGFVVEIHPNESCESFKRNWFDITPASFRFTS